MGNMEDVLLGITRGEFRLSAGLNGLPRWFIKQSESFSTMHEVDYVLFRISRCLYRASHNGTVHIYCPLPNLSAAPPTLHTPFADSLWHSAWFSRCWRHFLSMWDHPDDSGPWCDRVLSRKVEKRLEFGVAIYWGKPEVGIIPCTAVCSWKKNSSHFKHTHTHTHCRK